MLDGPTRKQPDIKVTLLGTGGPELTRDRMGAATLIEAGGKPLLFDAGRGVLQRLYECGVHINSVTRVILTHLHSDHIDGLPNLWITPWFLLGRSEPMKFWGPHGTRKMLVGMRDFLGHDVTHRVRHDCPAEALETPVNEFEGEGVIFDGEGCKVTAVPVHHPTGNPAYGFIIEANGRKVVMSGDCAFSEELVQAGAGADLTIHNVFAPSDELLNFEPHKRQVAMGLASPEQAGEFFRRSRSRMGVFSHVINLDSTDEDILRRARSANYDGEMVIGADRMVLEVGDELRVRAPPPLDVLQDVTSRGHG